MSNNSKYIITNLSNSLGQRNRVGGNSGSQAGVMPFLLSQPGVISLRDTNLPYISGEQGALDIYDWKIVSGTADAGGGGGIPESITANTRLLHWWKMNDGSSDTATDYGLSASAGVSDLSLDGVTTDAAGPSENGTPAAISFDGVNDSANVKLVDAGGSNTVVGDLIDTGGGWTISLWVKDEKSPDYDTFDSWFQGSTTAGPGTDGFGSYFIGTLGIWWLWNSGGNRSIEAATYPTGGWLNLIITYPDVAASPSYMKTYFNGSEVSSYGSIPAGSPKPSTSIGTTADARLSFGCITAPDGTTSYHTAPILSDIRLYNKVLSGAEISAIAAGDWT